MKRNLLIGILWFLSAFISCSYAWSADFYDDDGNEATALQQVRVDNEETSLTLAKVITAFEKSYVKRAVLDDDNFGQWLLGISILAVFIASPGIILKCPTYFNSNQVESSYPSVDENGIELNATQLDGYSFVDNICPLSLSGFLLPAVSSIYPTLKILFVGAQNYYADHKNAPKQIRLNRFIAQRSSSTIIPENDMDRLASILSEFPDLAKELSLIQAMSLAEKNAGILKNVGENFFKNRDVAEYMKLLFDLQQQNSVDVVKKLGGLNEAFVKAPCFWQTIVRTISDDTFNESASVLKDALYKILPEKSPTEIDEIFNDIRTKANSINKILARSGNARS